MCPSDLLLLDEPTNHLDMEMRHALSMAMQNYEGAIILVSHDRSLINTVTDQLVLIRSGSVDYFNEDMGAYLRILKQSARDQTGVAESGPKPSATAGVSKRERRQILAQRRQQLRPRRDKVRQLENAMHKLQNRIEALNVTLNDPETYATQSTSGLAGLMQQKADLERELEKIESDWVDSMGELEQLESLVGSGAL